MIKSRMFLFNPLLYNISLSDNVDQDQTTLYVQSDLDLYCPQKVG